MLRLALLGTPEVSLHGHSLLDQLAGRGLALVVYLAVTSQPHSRRRLADLLWQDVANEEALKKLRNLLPRVRPPLSTHLQITRDSLAFDKSSTHWLDVDVLRTHLIPSAGPPDPQILENVLGLYRADFLADMELRDAPVFEEWVVQQREELHRLVIHGFHRLADHYLKQGDYQAGLTATQRLLTLEPWREEAHRQQMLLFAKQGERTAALTQFTLCQRVLADEFGIEPAAETVRLYEQLRNNTFDNRIAAQQPIPPPTLPSLPTRPAPPVLQANWDEIPRPLRFYGREGELKMLGQWINQERCRLIGLFGLEGQGKTTLMAHWLRAAYAPSTPSTPAEPALAHILWCSLSAPLPLTQLVTEWLLLLTGQQPAALPTRSEQQFALLLYHLRQQRCLLVLDKLEQVLPAYPEDEVTYERNAGYTELLQWVVTGDHQSCLVVISQQRPMAFTRWEEQIPAVRSLQLQGLSDSAGRQLLSVYGLRDSAAHTLVRRYAGCPLALIAAAETTQELFAGNIDHFLQAKIWVSADLHSRLYQKFDTLTATEQTILLWLALAQAPLSFDALYARLVTKPNKRVYLDACRALLHRSWIETCAAGFALPDMVLTFLTGYLVEQVSQELLDGNLTPDRGKNLLNRYCFLDVEAPLSIQERQIQLVLQPILETLLDHRALPNLTASMQARLEALLTLDADQPSYAQANLHFLLLQLETTVSATPKLTGWLATLPSPMTWPKTQIGTAPQSQWTWLLAANNSAQLPNLL